MLSFLITLIGLGVIVHVIVIVACLDTIVLVYGRCNTLRANSGREKYPVVDLQTNLRRQCSKSQWALDAGRRCSR